MKGEYFRVLESLSTLVGETGLLRLPNYIFKEYVFDKARREALERALVALMEGENVLIVGNAGVGKTALMAIIIKKLMDRGIVVGYIVEGVREITNKHAEEGIIVFYDDIPRMRTEAVRSIVTNGVRNILATSRLEEIDDLRRKLGVPIEEIFTIVEIGTMENIYLREILSRFAKQEGIEVDPEAVEIVINKARNLPVYIWQVIRDLRLQGLVRLDRKFAERIPMGMLNYVDDILWRILDEHPDRYPLLLTLLIISDLPKYEINSDLLVTVFTESLREMRGTDVGIADAALHELFGKILKYLMRIDPYTYKLPHDSWGDVLKGRSSGLMSGEISRINLLYPKDKRMEILARATDRTEAEIMPSVEDVHRRESFEEFVSRLGISIRRAIVEKEEKEFSIELYAATMRTLPLTKSRAKYSAVYKAIINSPTIWSLLGKSKSQISRETTYVLHNDNAGELRYPATETFRIEHRFQKLSGSVTTRREYISLVVQLFLASLMLIGIVFLIVFMIHGGDISQAIFWITVLSVYEAVVIKSITDTIIRIKRGIEVEVVLERIKLSGGRTEVMSAVDEIKNFIRKKRIRILRLNQYQRKLLEKLGYDPQMIKSLWETKK